MLLRGAGPSRYVPAAASQRRALDFTFAKGGRLRPGAFGAGYLTNGRLATPHGSAARSM